MVTPHDPVSPREAEVLAALGERLTNAEIAQRLHISIRTVESHVSTLLRKLDATHRRELGAFASLIAGQAAARDTLPVILTSFLGRAEERRLLGKSLRDTRLVMLTGPGGVGKTRLAIEIARDAADHVGEDLWFVDLTTCSDAASVVAAVATALGATPQPGRTVIDGIVSRLRGSTALVVLDNCEQVLDPVVDIATKILGAGSGVQVMATSREALGIPGERVINITPLLIPEPDEASLSAVAATDSVRLFVDRASAVQSGFVLNEANARHVVSICRRLDGIPLAIELAAAQVGVLGPAQLDELLADSFALLKRERGDSDPRHLALDSTMAWSYDRLDTVERAVMDRLAVFRGTFSLDAVAAVVVDDPVASSNIVATVASLVRKSLVASVDGGERRRYRLLETVREYSWRELVASGDLDRRRESHFGWALDLAGRAAQGLAGSTQVQWLDALDQDLDNIEMALDWSLGDPARAADALNAVVALFPYWLARGIRRPQGIRWSEATAMKATNLDRAARTRALVNGVLLVMWSDLAAGARLAAAAEAVSGNDDQSRALAATVTVFLAALRGERVETRDLEKDCETFEAGQSDWLMARGALGFAALARGEYAKAHSLLHSVAVGHRDLGDEHLYGGWLNFCADLSSASGHLELASSEASEVLAIARHFTCRSCESFALSTLAMLGANDEFGGAVGAARRAVGLATDIHDTHGLLAGMDVLSGVLAIDGQAEEAVTIAAATASLREATGFAASPGRAAFGKTQLALARAALDTDSVERLWRDGQSLSYGAAIERATASASP